MTRKTYSTSPWMFAAGLCLLTSFASQEAPAQTMTLDVCPSDYGSFPEDAPTLACGCSAAAVKEGNVRGANPYYHQSSLCRAALHAGAIGADGGQISVKPEKSAFFPAVAKNGVETESWGEGMGFRIEVAGDTAPAQSGDAAAAPAQAPANQKSAMMLDVCPSNYGNFPEDAPALTCGCSADAVKEGNVRGANPYYHQSSLCRAALHAGAIGADGGQISVKPEKSAFFPAVAKNGVETDSWGEGMGFRVEVAGSAQTAQADDAAAASAEAQGGEKSAMTLDVCPSNYGNFPEDAPPLTCGCSADAVKQGNIRGANPYYHQSALCRAALHAGAVTAEGGQIQVEPATQPFFPAVIRNGVDSDSWGKGKGFRIRAAGGVQAEPVFDAASDGELTLDVCPTNYGGFPEDAPALTCDCSAEAVEQGNVRGANPYYHQSSLCRAALHAGAASPDGGKIVVRPEKASVFPAVAKNGVESDSWGKGMGFRVDPAPGSMTAAITKPAVDGAGKPVQAPIAETLKATGRVQLYVNFATDQDKPLPASEPVLQELLAALQGEPALRVELIGHTDSQGNAPYNLDLSQRRAAGVYLWLIQHGIESGRLRSDGRGLMEPIADNATDSGRALNRRVEVKAVN